MFQRLTQDTARQLFGPRARYSIEGNQLPCVVQEGELSPEVVIPMTLPLDIICGEPYIPAAGYELPWSHPLMDMAFCFGHCKIVIYTGILEMPAEEYLVDDGGLFRKPTLEHPAKFTYQRPSDSTDTLLLLCWDDDPDTDHIYAPRPVYDDHPLIAKYNGRPLGYYKPDDRKTYYRINVWAISTNYELLGDQYREMELEQAKALANGDIFYRTHDAVQAIYRRIISEEMLPKLIALDRAYSIEFHKCGITPVVYRDQNGEIISIQEYRAVLVYHHGQDFYVADYPVTLCGVQQLSSMIAEIEFRQKYFATHSC